jgi:RNA-binding protein
MLTLTRIKYHALAIAAHQLKPLLFIGKEGVTEPLVRSIYEAFNTRELLKVKALDFCPDDRETLSGRLGALPDITLVRNVGNTYILYKPFPPKEEKLPEKKTLRKVPVSAPATRLQRARKKLSSNMTSHKPR